MENRLYFGPAGWLYDDWKGIVYPQPAPRGFDALPYLARSVNLVEINATFYAPMRREVAAGWAARLAGWPEFRFVVKAWERFTHDAELPAAGETARWNTCVEALAESGRLLAVLIQFPFSFRDDDASRARILAIRKVLPPVPLAAEFRHRSWMDPGALRFLEQHGLAFVNIDQPVSADGLPPTAIVTAPLTYVRLHGRNRAAWFDPGAGRDARYDYRYPPEEIAEWAERTARLRERSAATLLVGNNHYQGKSVAAVLSLAAALTETKVVVPDPMLDRFPELQDIRRPAAGDLF